MLNAVRGLWGAGVRSRGRKVLSTPGRRGVPVAISNSCRRASHAIAFVSHGRFDRAEADFRRQLTGKRNGSFGRRNRRLAADFRRPSWRGGAQILRYRLTRGRRRLIEIIRARRDVRPKMNDDIGRNNILLLSDGRRGY